MVRIRLATYIQNILIVVSAVVLYSCNSKPEFVFLGEAEGRAENFGSEIEVTNENIEQLYQKYDTYQLFDGEYYLIRSKQSYNNSRYLSRLIRMKEGKQVAAKTFYDCSIDTCNVLEFGNKLLIGLNSLQNNYYNPTSHKAKVVILNKDLSPVIGSIFSSKKGHTYIQSLFVCSDNTFICSLESAEVIGNPYGQHQYRFRPDFSIIDSIYTVTWSSEYEIVRGQMDLTKPDWGNDLSDEELMRKKDEKEKKCVANDMLPIAETLPQRNDSVNKKVDSSKIAPVAAEPIKEKEFITVQEPVAKPLTQKERFDNAKRRKDWNSMKQLADEGYSPAYLPLARHYMKNSRQHGLAKKYAEKAKRAGLSGAKEILNELEDLDF